MKKQYAVLGLGIFGTSVALELETLGCEVIVVDNNMEKVQEISEYVSYAICADIQDSEVMKSLGAKNLDGAIVAIGNNLEGSVLATICAKEAGIPFVIAKAQSELHERILKKVGADSIIRPEKEMGTRIARSLVSGNFADWIELSDDYSMLETKIPKNWVGKQLIDLKIREKYGVNVVGIVENGKMDVTIDPYRIFVENTIVILIGSKEALKRFEKE